MSESAGDARTFVLVPGGWRGGWTYELVVERLAARGHVAHALTLAGLGPEPAPGANLDTHVAQVAEAVRGLDGQVVLVGHSYGGMVITGAADRLPGRIERLVYVDAYVPVSGESCWELTSDTFRSLFANGAAADGLTVAPPSRRDPRVRPHPIACFLQALRLDDGAALSRVPRSFVDGGDWPGSPFPELVARLRSDPGWTVHDLPVGHDVPRLDPDGLARVLGG